MKKRLNKGNRQISKSAVSFYVLAIISFGIFIYSMYSVYSYLGSLVEAGQITWAANWSDMIGYYLGSSNGFNYLLFAAMLAGIGYVIALMKKAHAPAVEDITEVFPETLEETKEEIVIDLVTDVEETK